MIEIKEGSTSVLELNFRDENGAEVVPDSCQYKIDDVLSEREIRQITPFNPSSSTHNLVIQSNENNIVDRDKTEEIRKVTVICMYDSSTKQMTDQFKYKIKNLKFLDTSLNVYDSKTVTESVTITIA